MRRARLRLFQRIILPFLLITLLGAATTLPYGISIVDQLQRVSADRQLATVSAVAGNYLDVQMDELLAYSQTVINNDSVKEAFARRDSSSLLRQLLPRKARLKLGLLAAYDREGRPLVGLGPTDLLSTMGQGDVLYKALLGIHLKSLEMAGGRMVLLAAVPNEVGRRMDGFLVAGYVVDENFIGRLSSLIDHQVALLDPEGRLVEASDRGNAARLLEALPEDVPLPAYVDFEAGGQPWRGRVSDLTVYGFPKARVAVASPTGVYLAVRKRLATVMAGLSLLGAALVIVMGLVLARSVTNPIRKLLSLTVDVGRGNLHVTVDDSSRDELGDLSRSFNGMVRGLRENLAEITSSRTKISRYAQELERHSLQLERDKRQTEAIVNSMRDGLVMVDRQGLTLAVNPEARRILCCSGETPFLGISLASLLARFLEDLEDPRALLDVIDPGREAVSNVSTVEVRSTASRTIWRVKIFPVFTQEKEVLGRILLWTNVTREKEVEEMKDNFLATISHELRTPLTSIKGSLNLLADGNLGPVTTDQREFIRIANQNSDRLIALVSNLLDLARMEAGEFRTRKTPADLAGMVHKALTDIKGLARGQAVSIEFETDVASAPVVADPDRIVQILTNLLDNGIKFSPAGGTVSITLAEEHLEDGQPAPGRWGTLPPGRYFRVTVADRGAGIPAAHMDRIFDKFHQADMSTTRVTGGAGLGLAIAKSIVRDHAGAIWAENLSGGGSAFSFLLPRAT